MLFKKILACYAPCIPSSNRPPIHSPFNPFVLLFPLSKIRLYLFLLKSPSLPLVPYYLTKLCGNTSHIVCPYLTQDVCL